MDRLKAFGNFSTAEALRVNYCRLYLGAYLASDIMSPDRWTIQPSCFKGTRAQRSNTPSVKFPRQARPDNVSWAQWRRALRFLFTSPRCNQLLLLVPLGPWLPLQHDSPRWTYYRSSDSLVVRSRLTNVLTKFPLERRDRRTLTYLKHHGRRIPILPPNSLPIGPPSEDRCQWATHPSDGLNVIASPVLPPPPKSFKDYASRLDPALRALVADVELVRPIEEIAQLLSSTSTLTLVGDGGAKTCRGSYGAVAALDSIRILRVKGPVSGPDPRSYQAEAHAMAAVLLSVVLLHQVLPRQPDHYSSL
jgi:hypothetical protein